jgi:uncharacterized circularly permuted ATP-grasp superfamily protein
MASELDPAFDEAWIEPGVPRPHYGPLLDVVAEIGPLAMAAAVKRTLAANEVTFGRSPFVVDPVPRLITADEWRHLELGLTQRARALNRFLIDVYGAQEIVAAGVIRGAVIETAEGFEPDLMGRLPPHPWPAAIIGFDVVRAPDGEFLVLEDNLRTPSGFAYAVAARTAVQASLRRGLAQPRPLEPAIWELLAATMRAAMPAGESDAVTVLLTDGPDNVAYYEHALAAHALGATLAVPQQLVRDGERLRLDGHGSAVGVVYRRTNEDRLRDEHGEHTLVAKTLLEPWLAGRVGLINGFGNGVADDKLVHSHVEDFIRFYLAEEPRIRSVPTTDVESDPGGIVDQLDQLVLKPRHGHGGRGVVIGPHAGDDTLKRLGERLREDPRGFIAQPTVTLSVHPTVIAGHLKPRHLDLRAFTAAAEDVALIPGGLSRVALDEGALVVNSSQEGGGKDTWVMTDNG